MSEAATLAAPLARAHRLAIVDHDPDCKHPEHERESAAILAALRSDPEVLAALAEALSTQLGWPISTDSDTATGVAAALLDALLGPKP